jgi:hypothetical protein
VSEQIDELVEFESLQRIGRLAGCIECSRGGFHISVELGEGVFDRIEAGTAGLPTTDAGAAPDLAALRAQRSLIVARAASPGRQKVEHPLGE